MLSADVESGAMPAAATMTADVLAPPRPSDAAPPAPTSAAARLARLREELKRFEPQSPNGSGTSLAQFALAEQVQLEQATMDLVAECCRPGMGADEAAARTAQLQARASGRRLPSTVRRVWAHGRRPTAAPVGELAQGHLRSTVMQSVGKLLDDCRTRLSDLWEQLLAEIQMREAAEFQQMRLEREVARLREELGITPLEPAPDAAEPPQPSTPVRGAAGEPGDEVAVGDAGPRPERAAKASPRLSALASALRLRKPTTKGRGGKPSTGPASASVERAPAGLPLGNASAGTSEESAATASPDDHGAVESVSEPQLVGSGSGRTTAPTSARGDGHPSTFTSPHAAASPTPSSPSRRTPR